MFVDPSASSVAKWVLLGVGVAGVAGIVFGTPLLDILAGKRDLSGQAKWEAPQQPPLMYGTVDLRDAYTGPLTTWSIQSAREEADRPQLRDALAAAPELWARFEAVQAASSDLENTEPLFDAVREINRQSAEKDAPVWVQGWIQNGFYLKSYEVVSEHAVPVGDSTVRARFVRRLDKLNVREGRLGSVSDPIEGAIVLVDRTRDFALEDLWPLLGAAPTEGRTGAFRFAVRQAVGEALGLEKLELLEQSLEPRLRMVEAAEALNKRGKKCRTMRLSAPDFGYTPEVMEDLRRVELADRHVGACARVTRAELQAFDEAFAALVTNDDAQTALKGLFALAGHGVLLHEARHAADADPLTCDGCPDVLEGQARREASAYLASLQQPSTAPLALFQMCSLLPGRGSHVRAVEAILEGLSTTCDEGVPDDLVEAAIALDGRWFGQRPAPRLPDDAPKEFSLF